jgi:hypothetical protein
MDAQLRIDLAQRPSLGVKVGCTLNVHGATATNLSPCIWLVRVAKESR